MAKAMRQERFGSSNLLQHGGISRLACKTRTLHFQGYRASDGIIA
jgi:hypothetical protein